MCAFRARVLNNRALLAQISSVMDLTTGPRG
nr:MAG TPA: hypothetical protein [Microviridae sp.]